MKIPENYLKKVIKTDSCWLWNGHINNSGYGRFNAKDMPDRYVHRAMFYWANGYLPARPNVVGHSCDVRSCVNPGHLSEQTQQENVRQYSQRITSCPSGHEYDINNTYIRKGGSRKCRECNRLSEQRRLSSG
jgi:hypothetical protein